MTGSKEFFLKFFLETFFESALKKNQFELIYEMCDCISENRKLLLEEIFGGEKERADFFFRCNETRKVYYETGKAKHIEKIRKTIKCLTSLKERDICPVGLAKEISTEVFLLEKELNEYLEKGG